MIAKTFRFYDNYNLNHGMIIGMIIIM